MARIEERTVRWGRAVATVKVRVWSMRDRDAFERKWGIAGEKYVGAVVAALGAAGAKGLQIARSLADEQRRRLGEQGQGPTLEKIAQTVLSVDAGETQLKEDAPPEFRREWLGDLDADLFDSLTDVVEEVLSFPSSEVVRLRDWVRGKADGGSIPLAKELNAFLVAGALPDPGGLRDQEAPFVDALSVVTDELARIMRARKGAVPGAR